MNKLRDIIEIATTEMLDAPDEHGVYPVTKFLDRLEGDINAHIKRLTSIDAGMVARPYHFSELVHNLSNQTTLTPRLQNAIATYLECQSSPVRIIDNPDIDYDLLRNKK